VKAAAFSWHNADDLADASRAARDGARVIAGGQSLGPMLNFRAARPAALVRVAGIPELRGVSETATQVLIGAAVTHAEIADGLAPEIGGGVLAAIASGIAYRAVRNAGTIGGSLCHADPAADWVTTLLALGAAALTFGQDGGRAIPLTSFFAGAYRTVLAPGEILRAVNIPKLRGARWGYYKLCRKPGEFAQAMAAVCERPDATRLVVGAVGGAPVIFENAEAAAVAELLPQRATLDAVALHLQLVAVKRAWEALRAWT
jgi:carbon-monoxide dehydrogenase medium subunit